MCGSLGDPRDLAPSDSGISEIIIIDFETPVKHMNVQTWQIFLKILCDFNKSMNQLSHSAIQY